MITQWHALLLDLRDNAYDCIRSFVTGNNLDRFQPRKLGYSYSLTKDFGSLHIVIEILWDDLSLFGSEYA